MGSEKRKIKSTEKGIFTSQQVPELQPRTPGPISPRSSLMRPILLFQATTPTPSTTKKKEKLATQQSSTCFFICIFFKSVPPVNGSPSYQCSHLAQHTKVTSMTSFIMEDQLVFFTLFYSEDVQTSAFLKQTLQHYHHHYILNNSDRGRAIIRIHSDSE